MIDFSQARTVMVDTQVRPNDVTKYPVIDAMLAIPREEYVPETSRSVAYLGENLHIGDDRWLLEPRTLAKMLDALDIQGHELVLNIAAGLGYDAAVIAQLAQAVVALEPNAAMVRRAETTLSEQNIDNVAVVTGGLTEGYPGQAPYDVIVISGAIEELPQNIADQLKEGGRIAAIFLEGHLGVVRIGHKTEGHIDWRFSFNGSAPLLPGFARARAFTF